MTIAKKFMLVLGLIFVAGILMAILAVYQHQRSTVGEQAENESARISREAVRLLTVTDAIMLERVKSSMALLKEYGAEFGEPRLGEPVRVNDRDALNLYLGETPIANAFDLVDHVTQIMGGTATIFARDRDEFVRISPGVPSVLSLRRRAPPSNRFSRAARSMVWSISSVIPTSPVMSPLSTARAPLSVSGTWVIKRT